MTSSNPTYCGTPSYRKDVRGIIIQQSYHKQAESETALQGGDRNPGMQLGPNLEALGWTPRFITVITNL